MAEATAVTLIKEMTYRGQLEEWSNQYWLSGTPPQSDAGWKTLADQLIADEVACYLGSSKVIRAYGYNDNTPNADSVWTWDYKAAAATVAGTAVTSTGTYPAGDQAAWVRWGTSRFARGKRIYLRKYFHSVPTDEDSPSTQDNVAPGWATAATTFATKLRLGTAAHARTLRSQTSPETIVNQAVSTYITVRQLRRRGKRPPTP